MARQRNISTGIDIGTAAVKVVVAEFAPDERIVSVKAIAKTLSGGLRHGHIIDVAETAAGLKAAIREAQKLSGLKIRRAILGLGGVGLRAMTAAGSVAISRADSEVTDFDIRRALSAAESVAAEKPNVKIIHAIPQEFKIDGKKILGRPEGIRGSKLEVKTLFISALAGGLAELIKAVEEADLAIEDIFATPLAESVVTATALQKRVGCALLDIGAETVSLAVFDEGVLTSLQVFPLGSTNITNDIALGLRVSLEEAEELKIGKNPETKQLKKKVDEIIEARLFDIFELVETHLKKIGRSGLLPAGIILVGAGAQLAGLAERAKERLELPARIADNVVLPDGYRLPEIKNIPSAELRGREFASWRERHELVRGPEWSAAYGLSMLGLGLDSEETLGNRLVRNARSRVWSWLKQLLP